jgi:hypothetical protein
MGAAGRIESQDWHGAFYTNPRNVIALIPCWRSWRLAWASVEAEKRRREVRDIRDRQRYAWAINREGIYLIVPRLATFGRVEPRPMIGGRDDNR